MSKNLASNRNSPPLYEQHQSTQRLQYNDLFAQLFPAPDCLNTKLSRRKICQYEPDLILSIVPSSRSIRT
uniref:Putative ovule protein n=1 Tax=Solanum chacoense TaxID=4108 RepID=A0A0V0GP27_SOLCH